MLRSWKVEKKIIKSGQDVVREYIANLTKDPNIDRGTIGAIERVLAEEGKLSVTKLLRELDRLRKE
jgi:hypothetical protein